MKLLASIFFALAAAALQASETRLPQLRSIPVSQPFTFVVFGDNRGDDSGEQPNAFFQVLKAVGHESPAFVLDTGDMIYGHNRDEAAVREMWRVYRSAADRLRAPIFHIPGNHDIWDEQSARIYHELWGPSYFSFVYGNSRFIGLDTESVKNQITGDQFQWLEQQFEQCTQSNVFVFFHCPLFPTDAAVGSSLDQFPDKRDLLHRLFVQHRDRIRGVFAGHEHLFAFQDRDGVPYYISGGGGAPLYTAPELGGFHHFLLVRVAGTKIEVQVQKVCAPSGPLMSPRKIQVGELLESWNQGLFWYGWDRSTSVELTTAMATQGRNALRLNYDLAQYEWPVLVLPLFRTWDLGDCESLSLDIYVPPNVKKAFTVAPAIHGLKKNEAPQVKLKSGWNTVVTPLDTNWLSETDRKKTQSLEWGLSGVDKVSSGYVVFDNLRAKWRKPNGAETTEVLESWERPLLWRTFDETVNAEIVEQRGLTLHLDASTCKRPILFAQLNPPWDLTTVKEFELQIEAPETVPKNLTIGLTLRSKDVAYAAPVKTLEPGAQKLRFDLTEGWLPQSARIAVEQIAFRIVSTNSLDKVDVRFTKLAAAADRN